jgi:hypothetical protein
MTKKFTVSVPDEPYKNLLNQDKSIEITYTGPNFLVITYDPQNNRVQTVDGYFNTEEEIDLSTFADDRFAFAVVNAETNLLACSIITNFYNHDTLENYTETLVTGEEYVYTYSTNGILDDLFNRWDLKYYPETQTFNNLEYQSYPTSREQFLESLTKNIEYITAQKQLETDNEDSEEKLARFDEIITWCQNFEDTYGDTDHWKIPFPTL